jgi:DNA polymerase III delta prime subunit
MSDFLNKLWVEKWRPSVADDFVFHSDAQKKSIVSFIKNQEFPNLLFSGVQGSGKTTLAKILINECNLDESDVMILNASDENSVDVIREKISSFANSFAMGRFKVVLFDEFDYTTPNAQAALRNLMEECSDNCRFIFTCNYENKVIPPIKSRVQTFQFKSPSIDEVTIRLGQILVEEGIDFDLETLDRVVRATYPDIRKAINVMQQCSVDGKLSAPNAEDTGDYHFKLLDLIEANDLKGFRKIICETIPKEEYEGIFRFLYENLHKAPSFKADDKYEQGIVVIASYLHKHSMVADTEINMAALCIELGQIANG